MRPLSIQEQEYREGLFRLERRSIIPLKATLLFITFIVWVGLSKLRSLHPVGIVFGIYALSIAVESAMIYAGRVRSEQIRPLTLISYLLDVVFVTMLIFFDLATTYFGPETHNDFYVLYFLLVMRGFALFKTIAETIFVNLLISVLFVLMNYLQTPDMRKLINPEFAQRLVLIWLVILMSWFVVMVINRQKIEMMEIHDRLMRAEGLARVGMLASGVAHEINNPIGVIAASADYLLRYQPGDVAEIQEEVAAIQREAMRCKEIVQQMLTYANPRPIGKVAVDICALNDEVLSFVLPPTRESRFETVREYDPERPLIEADPNLLKQALLNLYLNAKQAFEEGQPGRIVARVLKSDRGRAVRIEIEDNGRGIVDDDLEKIFQPFFTRKAKGTGLGLAVTQRIVEAFDGSIAVERARPNGAIFILEFPMLRR